MIEGPSREAMELVEARVEPLVHGAAQPWVEHIADAVAEQIECQHGDRDREARK